MAGNVSVVQFFPYDDESSSCGYCKSQSSRTNGMWAYKLDVQDYQNLINRGWRRSGHYCYKPIMNLTCCPMYTIRCLALDFNPSKSQRRVMKRFQKYLLTGEKGTKKECQGNSSARDAKLPCPAKRHMNAGNPSISKPTESFEMPSISAISNPKFQTTKSTIDFSKNIFKWKMSQKAKHKRITRKYEKLKAKGLDENEIAAKMVAKKKMPILQTLESFLIDNSDTIPTNKLDVRLVKSCPPSVEFVQTFNAEFELYKKYQVAIHKDSPEEVNQKSFERFLVKSPLIAEGPYGSYHQQYWLNGILIAVIVVDILPLCVSSVYLFYDPAYSFLTLGTYGALREIALVRQLHRSYPNIQYYYMGYYIHTCPKMKYKAAFKPSYLLCPEVFTWHDIITCAKKLDSTKYSKFNENSPQEEEEFDYSEIPVYYGNREVKMKDLSKAAKGRINLRLYTGLVGQTCSLRMVLYVK